MGVKTIIAGSRGITEAWTVEMAVRQSMLDVSEVVSGGANGVDKLGEKWAADHDVPCRVFPADWDTHGKAAGPIRNSEMAEYAEALVAVWDGKSRGTKDMIDKAKKKNLLTYVTTYSEMVDDQ